MKTIAFVRIKALPGRRFRVVEAQAGLCLTKETGHFCALFDHPCNKLGMQPHCTVRNIVAIKVKDEEK